MIKGKTLPVTSFMGKSHILLAEKTQQMMKYLRFCAQYCVCLCALEMKVERKSLRHAAWM